MISNIWNITRKMVTHKTIIVIIGESGVKILGEQYLQYAPSNNTVFMLIT